MRSINWGLSVLFLAACTVHIGETATDSAGGSETGTGSASTSGSSGEAPTTGASQTSGEASTGPASATEATSTTEATASSGGTSGGSDSGLTGGSSGDTDAPAPGDATVDDACAPDDGPALEFRLELSAPTCGATWSGDVLRVMLYQGGPLAPGSYMLDGGMGFAWLQQGDLPPVTSETGTIVIDAWDGEMVSGSYMLTGLGVDVIEGSFAGPHCAAGGLCG